MGKIEGNMNFVEQVIKTLGFSLQVLAITQCLSVIVGSAFLAVMLRTQLNLLAGALYQQVTIRS